MAGHQIVRNRKWEGMDLETAFSKSTDGPNCPYARCWTQAEFAKLVKLEGFEIESYGAAISQLELDALSYLDEAIASVELNEVSRSFLREISLTNGLPTYRGNVAGIDGCYKLRPT